MVSWSHLQASPHLSGTMIKHHVTGSYVPKGYVTFKSDNGGLPETNQIHARDVTSPIDPEDHTGSLDSSGGRAEFNEYDDDTNAFSKTGAMTIISSSSSSGGLVAAFGIGQHSSSTDDDVLPDDQSVKSDPGQRPKPPTKVTDPGQGHTSPDLPAKKKSAQTNAVAPETKAWPENNENKVQRGMTVHPQTQHKPDTPTARVNPFPPPTNPITPVIPLNPTQNPPNAPLSTTQNAPSNHLHTTPNPIPAQVPPNPYVVTPTPPQVAPTLMVRERGTHGPKTGGPAGLGFTSPPEVGQQGTSLKPRPQDLQTLLQEIGLSKYMMVFEEQDVDLQVFLSLTDNDLKEVGIKLFGPRRKMTNTIARWHSNAPPSGQSMEQAYADKLEAEMQEMAIQLHQAYDQVEHLKAQVLQERELRSVTEGCLIKMEDRTSRQHVVQLAADTLQCCSETQEGIKRAKHYTEELVRRRLPKDPPTTSASGVGDDQDTLVKAIHKGQLSLGGGSENPLTKTTPSAKDDPLETPRMPVNTLVQHISAAHDDIWRAVTIATHNVEKLLGRNAGFSTTPGGVGGVRGGFS